MVKYYPTYRLLSMKIFLSSPQIGLENYRKAVKDALESMGIKDFFISEYEGSRSECPINVCMYEIERCNLFILLLGDRYGTIPEHESISFTEMEFNKAKDLKKDIIVFHLKMNSREPKQMDFIKRVSHCKTGHFIHNEIVDAEELKKRVCQDVFAHLARKNDAKSGEAREYLMNQISQDEMEIRFKESKIFELPGDDGKSALFLKARINYTHEAGAWYLMKIRVNDNLITEKHLLNKKLLCRFKDGRENLLIDPANGSWLIHYSANFKDNYYHPKYKVINGDPYIFIFDLSDVDRINGKYRICIEHMGTDEYQAFKNSIIISDMKIL